MPRKRFIRSDSYPYHIVSRSNNREWFYIPIEEFWRILVSVLALDPVSSKLKIHALVLMSNHFHLLASSVDGNLGEPMEYLLREVCRRVNQVAGRQNHVFGGPYKWSLITNTSYYLLCLKYIYRNPVSAHICEKVEEYPFSTLKALHQPNIFPFSIHPWRWAGDWLKWGDFQALLGWLNTPYPFGLSDYVKSASRYRVFTLPKSRTTRKVPQELWNNLEAAYQIAPYDFEQLSFETTKRKAVPSGTGVSNHPTE